VLESKKILVVYFSQSGQLQSILNNVLLPLREAGYEITIKEIIPNPPYPFPWTSDEFFDAFPETFAGIPCKLEPMDYSTSNDYDLVLLGYSPWYLSPSTPTQAFLQSDMGKLMLKNKKIVTIIGCRNMWLQAQEKIKRLLIESDSELVGNIVFRDKNPNLVSVITIIRWLLKGKQEKSRFFPRAGISENDIKKGSFFGELIVDSLEKNRLNKLQSCLIESGAVEVFPNLVLFENNGYRIFKIWSKIILRKGERGDKKRLGRVRSFKWYLILVLFLVTPLASIIYSMIKLFKKKKIVQEMQYFSQNKFRRQK
jgi:hypothetical protein